MRHSIMNITMNITSSPLNSEKRNQNWSINVIKDTRIIKGEITRTLCLRTHYLYIWTFWNHISYVSIMKKFNQKPCTLSPNVYLDCCFQIKILTQTILIIDVVINMHVSSAKRHNSNVSCPSLSCSVKRWEYTPMLPSNFLAHKPTM